MLHFKPVLGRKDSVKLAFSLVVAHQYNTIKVFILLSNLSNIESVYANFRDSFAISSILHLWVLKTKLGQLSSWK